MSRKTKADLLQEIKELQDDNSEKEWITTQLKEKLSISNNSLKNCKESLAEKEKNLKEIRESLSDRDNSIKSLNNTIKEKDKEIWERDDLIVQKTDSEANLNKTIASKDTEISKLGKTIIAHETTIANNKNTLKEKDDEISTLKSSLKKIRVREFAVAFESEKDEYKLERDKWYPIAKYSFIVLLFTTFILVFLSYHIWNVESIPLITIESIALLFCVFSVKQFLYFTQHYSDALRRQTLAQWYHNILKWNEDEEIKEDYREKLVDILCAKEKVVNDYKFPQEQALWYLKDIAENLGKK